ncbi:uncharacterized protein LOC114261201 isoform X3 [Camellia sinensis]|uniref:uncharacterized protein LOC114261201 isoform X3 n=1 Tax=Camellia sinensis TaxID=4442 RepID=UPI0010355258|nr:uncharacterized protein LOC114261201 isoform X3 [Camellia sinensis]
MACTSLVKLNASSSQWISWQSFNQRPGSSCRFASPRVSIVRAESYSDELVKTAVFCVPSLRAVLGIGVSLCQIKS